MERKYIKGGVKMFSFLKKRKKSNELEMDEWLGGRSTTDVLSYFITASILGDRDLIKYAIIDIAWRPDLREVVKQTKHDLLDTALVRPWTLVFVYAIIDMRRRSEDMIGAIKSLDSLNNLENAVRLIASTHLPFHQNIKEDEVTYVANCLRFICYH